MRAGAGAGAIAPPSRCGILSSGATLFLATLCAACTGEIEDPHGEAEPFVPGAHWAFFAPTRPKLPDATDLGWARNPLDRFVLAGLQARGLAPNGEADRRALIRRLSFDVTGLPPDPSLVQAFLDDPRDGAYDELVEALLASPAFGEHRARHWLDYARYADTHGLHYDNYRSIWPYRDWVIRAFNDNMPFDRFTIEQLAGDLLPDRSLSTLIATGFHRCAMSTNEPGIIPEEYEAIYAQDRVETTAAVWLGLTVGCARCHDHKFDPIPQRDFYRLAAFFRNTSEPPLNGDIPDTPPAVEVAPGITSLVMAERSTAPFAHVLLRGQYDQKSERVSPGFLRALPPPTRELPENRLGLARWLVAAEHPLTARVTVNRFWAEVFGTGLVATVDDFGLRGERPANQPLLDWLAAELRDSGWNVKHLFRLVLTSATYRQSAYSTAEKRARDPDNRLLSRGPRFRMDGEMIRDLALAASGLLVRTVGGPSVKPYQPAGIWEAVAIPGSSTGTYQPDSGSGLYRRSVYTFWKRSAPPPMLELFNAPTREASAVRRERTHTPLQALALMNDTQFVEAARQLALAAATTAGPDTGARLDELGSRVLSRRFTDEEKHVFSTALDALLGQYAAASTAAVELLHVGATPADSSLPPAEHAAWTLIASAILNLEEALNK